MVNVCILELLTEKEASVICDVHTGATSLAPELCQALCSLLASQKTLRSGRGSFATHTRLSPLLHSLISPLACKGYADREAHDTQSKKIYAESPSHTAFGSPASVGSNVGDVGMPFRSTLWTGPNEDHARPPACLTLLGLCGGESGSSTPGTVSDQRTNAERVEVAKEAGSKSPDMFLIESYKEMYRNQPEELRNLICEHLFEEEHTTDLREHMAPGTAHARKRCIEEEDELFLSRYLRLGLQGLKSKVVTDNGYSLYANMVYRTHASITSILTPLFIRAKAIDCDLRRSLRDLSLPDSSWECRVAAENLLLSAVELYSATEGKRGDEDESRSQHNT
ncbi:hypothetical protein GOODEAATRI_029603 [Goodea atripinnis]|uniref:Uncharacterized protein n=1 Tax=Goodea atripinnis TaxID=208336 RepID=A0ABV0P297_9TELE